MTLPYILAIDPGACTGFALMRPIQDLRRYAISIVGTEAMATMGDVSETRLGGIMEWSVRSIRQGRYETVIELPQVYRASRSKGDPNDLIRLAVLVGRLQQLAEVRGSEVTLVQPATWKGQVPKDVHHKRLMERLCREELEKLESLHKTYRHNALDAVGLGLWLGDIMIAKEGK